MIAASTPSRSTVVEHDLGAEVRALAQFQEADFAAQRAVLGQVAARLPHQPDRRAAGPARGGRLSSTGCRARPEGVSRSPRSSPDSPSGLVNATAIPRTPDQAADRSATEGQAGNKNQMLPPRGRGLASWLRRTQCDDAREERNSAADTSPCCGARPRRSI